MTLGGFLKSFSYIKNNKITKTYLSELSAGKKIRKYSSLFSCVFFYFFLLLYCTIWVCLATMYQIRKRSCIPNIMRYTNWGLHHFYFTSSASFAYTTFFFFYFFLRKSIWTNIFLFSFFFIFLERSIGVWTHSKRRNVFSCTERNS